MLPDSTTKSLFEQLTTAIILVDAQLRVQYLNSAAETLLEISEQRSLDEPLAKLLHEVDDGESGLSRAVDAGSGFTKRQTCLRLQSGHRTIVDYVVTPYSDDPSLGFIIEIVPLDRLLTISRAEATLASQRMTQLMVRGLAHEIKNPLGGLRGAAQLLSRELPSERLRDYTTIIIEEADRLSRLVNRMLGPSQQLHLETLNVHEVVERVRQLIQAEVGERLPVKRDYDPSIPLFLLDKEALIQATLNIARNAAHALLDTADSIASPAIVIRTRTRRQFTIGGHRHRLVCQIEIIDNGPGVPDDLADSLFLPMVSGRADGTGLGLTIAQSIVSQHEGFINCISEPGRTEFSIYLPIARNT